MLEDGDISITESAVFDVLAGIPILTKNELREHFTSLQSTQPRQGAYQNTSGGSTGMPARFMQDKDYHNWATGNKILFQSWIGHRPGDPHLKIWGAPKDIFGGGNPWKKAIRSFALNEHILNCYQTSVSTWHEYARRINRLRPTLIESYADAAFEFARFLQAEGVPLHKPAAVITSAGVLRPDMRQVIEAAFGVPVLNRYGSREVGDMACSCTSGHDLHICELTHLLEILDEEGKPCPPGVEGDIVVTLLTNHTMPLIRYFIGDRASWAEGPCPCGLTTRRLATVSGRATDYLVRRDATKINGTALTTLLYGVPGVSQYQFRQTDDRLVVLSIVLDRQAKQEAVTPHLESPLQNLAKLLGNDMHVDVRFTDAIPKTATGKHLYIVNEMYSPAPSLHS